MDYISSLFIFIISVVISLRLTVFGMSIFIKCFKLSIKKNCGYKIDIKKRGSTIGAN